VPAGAQSDETASDVPPSGADWSLVPHAKTNASPKHEHRSLSVIVQPELDDDESRVRIQQMKVVRIARDNRLSLTSGANHEMRVGDVSRSAGCQKQPDGGRTAPSRGTRCVVVCRIKRASRT
jgi:hypothetical protein